jgi:hypothetical protein
MVKYSDLKPGMIVVFNRSSADFDRFTRFITTHPSDAVNRDPEWWYRGALKKYENVPLRIEWNEVARYLNSDRTGQHLLARNPNSDGTSRRVRARTVVGNIPVYLEEQWFDTDNENAFTPPIPNKKEGRDIRNTRLMAARMGLPHGPESIIASQLSGLPGNAAQQNDDIKKKAGIQGPAPDRRGFSGGKTKKNRKRRRHTRKH